MIELVHQHARALGLRFEGPAQERRQPVGEVGLEDRRLAVVVGLGDQGAEESAKPLRQRRAGLWPPRKDAPLLWYRSSTQGGLLSQLLIQQYLNNLQDLRKVSGTNRESVVREAFKDLLKGYGRQHDLVFVPEYEIETPAKERRYVDGALLHELRVPVGYWEAKDYWDKL